MKPVSELENFVPWPADLRGWNYDHPIFDQLVEETRPKTIIEVGTWKGMSAFRMARACDRLGLDTKIYCVDTWLGSLEFMEEGGDRDLMLRYGYPQVYYQFLSNVIHEGHEARIIPVSQTSLIAARWFKKKEIKADLIYIDGSHEFEDVVNDLTAYYPLLSDERGIMFGDDYDHWPGVKEATYWFFSNETFQIIDNRYWVKRKS